MKSLAQAFVAALTVAGAWCTAAVTMPAVAAAENTLSPAEEKAGWRLLFDGRTTDGWRNYRREQISDGWQVRDGALVRAAAGAGDLITVEQFDHFELSLEYRISQGGNSGIMFHVTEDAPQPWHSGPEIQILDNARGRDAQKSGWLYQLYAPPPDPWTGKTADATRPAGQWNHVQLRVTPAECEINLNGYRYAQFQIGSDDWNRRVARSKFAQLAGFGRAGRGHICLQDHGDEVAFRNIKIRPLPPDGSVPNPVDGTLPVRIQTAFPHLKWAAWEPIDEQGRQRPLRPIVLTHAGDGSHRVFVANQYGEIYVFPNRPDVARAELFLDLRPRVVYKDSENEEGLLGLAFHPRYKHNGEFFVYYTTKAAPHTSVVSRFRVSGDPNRADPDSEEELLRIEQPFWNHNGGTLAFGPDGYLYIGLGDGGSANDPLNHAQNLGTLLGSILRIDVDRKSPGRNYAIPDDNPFVDRPEARGEIYAYGLRNVWRMAFDRHTGHLWCGDVGQNLWEEINIIVKGGNYGWNLREAAHPFGPQGSGPRADLIDPVWEYDHQVGKSITGGLVYRGKAVPELQGKYLYADYVSGKIWALHYDTQAGRVVSNHAIEAPSIPAISFGEDEAGEAYIMMVSPEGRGIFRFVRVAPHPGSP
jgi:glucose/arabinose dehydrogenase